MTLIDGDRIVTAQLYDDEHEEFIEKEMSIIDFINAYTEEGVTASDDVLDRIRAEIEQEYKVESEHPYGQGLRRALEIIDKYRAESEDKE